MLKSLAKSRECDIMLYMPYCGGYRTRSGKPSTEAIFRAIFRISGSVPDIRRKMSPSPKLQILLPFLSSYYSVWYVPDLNSLLLKKAMTAEELSTMK